jgi:1,4-alpha-glucan branching enzyme
MIRNSTLILIVFKNWNMNNLKSKVFNAGLLLFIILIFACTMENKHEGRSTKVIHPEWSKNAVIYEVNIRQYTPQGSFKAFEQHLPRLKEMGIGILWLMPVNPIGVTNRKGSLGSYYSIKDYMGVNPEFGTLDDLKHLVNKAHELGMKVIIDWVANHSSWDNNLITEHAEWYQHDSSGKIKSPVPDWTDVAGLDYRHPELCDYMTSALIWWVKNADVDGFRCDVASMLPVSFWNAAVPKIQYVKPVFMLAESDAPEIHDSAFDMTYAWDLYHLLNDIAKGKATADKIDSIWAKEASMYNTDSYRMQFTSNHDENSWNGTEYERMGDAALTMAALTFTVPGMPLIYSGQESGLNKRLRFFDKDTIVWDNYKLGKFYSTLINLKKSNKALWNGDFGGQMIRVTVDRDKEVYAFIRQKGDLKVLCIFNLSPHTLLVKLQGTDYTGNYKDVFRNTSVELKDGIPVNLNPWEYLILEK